MGSTSQKIVREPGYLVETRQVRTEICINLKSTMVSTRERDLSLVNEVIKPIISHDDNK